MPLQGKNLVLAVGGGIAAYKAADLASRLMKAGARVRVAMTPSASNFIAPLTFEAITGAPVYHQLFDQPAAHRMEHIEWARWADGVIVAPATASLMARLAAGLADDAVSTLYLAFRGPVWIAPAMNAAMWEHPATSDNAARLTARGDRLIGPGAGPLACGEVGEGRLVEPAQIVEIVAAEIDRAIRDRPPRNDAATPNREPETPAPSNGAAPPLAGRRVLITAGPTREALDPIRFISNRSSGRMGVELAAAALRLGARVTLIHGPLSVPIPPGVEAIPAETAEAMLAAVQRSLPGCAVAIFAAAVANFRPEAAAGQKIKSADRLTLNLTRTPDIAAWAGRHAGADRPLLVGFAAESEDLLAAARCKLQAKRLDLIFANPIGREGIGFAADDNEVTLIAPQGEPLASGAMPKPALARWIWSRLIERLATRETAAK